MKPYYRKDEKTLSIKNLNISENVKKIEFEETVVNKNVLYYENLFGAMKRCVDNQQTLSREEAYDLANNYITEYREPEKLVNNLEITFIDTAERFPIKLSKEKKKELKNIRKENQKIKKLKRSSK